jgi:phosphoribosylglycinamide formyltransferase-1
LISGRGSNLQALIDACATPDFPAEIVLVVSNVAGALGLQRAVTAGIATTLIRHQDHAGRDAFDEEVDRHLRRADVALVCLAGFMRLLGAPMVARWQGHIINIHPSLLPCFKGLHSHAQALAAGVTLHGCTVHHVTPALDAGPIIAQAAVPVLPGDDEDRLAARVLAAEHRLYPLALKLIASGAARAAAPESVLFNPAP